MSTLSNVTPLGDGALSPSAGLIPGSPSINAITAGGVSVRYAPDLVRHWYVLRATYSREQTASDVITAMGGEVYLPYHYVVRIVGRQRKRLRQSLLPNILFVRAHPADIYTYVNDTPELSFLRFYYDRTVVNRFGTNPPLVVDDLQMRNFISATSVDSDHILALDPTHRKLRGGDRVRVIDGPFCGVEGQVARVAGQQRVIVTIDGLCSIATAYIPTAFLQRL